MTQGEKAAIIKEFREEGYPLKYLIKTMRMAKSTYYFEISKEDMALYNPCHEKVIAMIIVLWRHSLED